MLQQIRNAVMLVQRYVVLIVQRSCIRCGTSTPISLFTVYHSDMSGKEVDRCLGILAVTVLSALGATPYAHNCFYYITML